ncbi:S1 family peptidase [Bradyrhizobium sp. RDT10]
MTTNAEGQTPPVQTSHRAVPDDNLAYPVRVYLKGSQGSGFFMATDEALYFATAKHVLYNVRADGKLFDNDLTLESYPADVNQLRSNVIAIDLAVVTATGALKSHPTTDVAIIKIGKIEGGRFHAGPGITLKELAPEGIVGASARDTAKKFDRVQISNDVYVFGYPNSIGLQQIPQIDQTRPLIRKGIVAGLNRKLRTIILDCEVYPGNSGGLVLEVENAGFQRNYRVIGLVSEYVPFDNSRFGIAANPTVLNSGYSVVIPIDFVLELIEKT